MKKYLKNLNDIMTGENKIISFRDFHFDVRSLSDLPKKIFISDIENFPAPPTCSLSYRHQNAYYYKIFSFFRIKNSSYIAITVNYNIYILIPRN